MGLGQFQLSHVRLLEAKSIQIIREVAAEFSRPAPLYSIGKDSSSVLLRLSQKAGELHHFTGLDDPYEPPEAPDIECHTERETLAESTAKVLDAIDRWLALRDDRTQP